MTEAEWEECIDPLLMLDQLRGKVSVRKVRLFTVACCWRITHLLDETHATVVSATEQFADALVSEDEFNSVTRALPAHVVGEALAWQSAVWWTSRGPFGFSRKMMNEVGKGAATCVACALAVGNRRLRPGELRDPELQATVARENKVLCGLLRCIIGNPFLLPPTPASLAWWGDAAVKLANIIYSERAFDQLPILADALEDAGCTETEMLNHCRGPGPHVRGCWVLDFLLGKS